MIVSALLGEEERFVAIGRDGRIEDLDQSGAFYHFPADHGTWLEVTKTTTRRRRLMHGGQAAPAQMALW